MRRLLRALVVLLIAVTAAGCGVLGGGGSQPGDIQVYSARQYNIEQAFLDFEKQTGLKVDFLFGDDAELRKRLEAEGANSPADIYMTVDAGNLWAAARDGVLQPLRSKVLDKAVPARYRDPRNRWFGLALRARTIAYNPDKVKPSDFDPVNTYAGLADPKWKGRLCMRDSTEAYTQSLIAALIQLNGYDATKQIVQGWLDNGVDIMSNDILLLQAVDAGTCDVAIVNHYYYANELEKNPNLNVKLYWASQKGDGVQMNLSGAGVVSTSDNKPAAQKLLEWLATDGQGVFVGGNNEYPVNPRVKPTPVLASFGTFKQMPINAAAYGRRNPQALQLMQQVGYK